MLDHIGFSVKDIKKATAFYKKALAPLDIAVIMKVTPRQTGDGSAHVGFGTPGRPFFWIGSSPKRKGSGRSHVAFLAPNRKTVDAFHKAALKAGGKDNGAPGLRPHYHPTYYGAFVIDLDGNNVEAVCHKPA
jgi:catechol 2,3-dioxygenase-like lactoylglutathione lyase family enzyme